METNKQELIKKNLFKIKKIAMKRFKSSFTEGGYVVVKNEIGIITPYFNEYRYSFEDNKVQVLYMNGEKYDSHIDLIEVSNTRIVNSTIKEKLEDVISDAKEVYSYQKQLAKLQEDFNKQKDKLSNKILKQNSSLEKSFTKLKNARGFMSNDEFIRSLNKNLRFDFTNSNRNKNFYEAFAKGCTATIMFKDDKVFKITVEKEVDFGKYTAQNYDFVYEEYDMTLHVGDLKSSKDFEKIKNKFFKTNKLSDLNKIKAEENITAYIGDKNSLYACQQVMSNLEVECTKDNLKEVEDNLKALLKFV